MKRLHVVVANAAVQVLAGFQGSHVRRDFVTQLNFHHCGRGGEVLATQEKDSQCEITLG